MSQVVCSNPRLICNPQLPELLCKYQDYYILGFAHHYPYKYRGLHDPDMLKPFYMYMQSANHDNLSEFYVLDKETGQTFPMFMEVPCGRCEICKRRKVSSFVGRCRLESQSYDYRPWFFTLTYDNTNLPDDGVSVREMQLFLKRLRTNLYRYGYREKIRYVACGEYGKNTKRPHYHLIIWNLHPDKYSDFKELLAIFEHSWDKGFVQSRIIDPSNDKSFYYTSKYLLKDCDVPKGKNPTFLVYSRGHGSIGSAKIDELSGQIRKSLNTSFQYFDKWRQKVVALPLSGYVINRVFPSLCRSVTSAVRTAVRKFDYFYKEFEERDPFLTEMLFKKTYEKLHLFKDTVYFGSSGRREHPISPLTDAQVYGHLCEFQSIIERACKKVHLYVQAREVDRLRSVFLGKFSFVEREYCIADYERRCRSMRLRSRSTEIL